MVSEETRRKISESQKKRYEDPEERRKISEGNKGKKRSEEERRKISEAQKKRYGTDPETPTGREIACEILKKHHEELKGDPERLTTEFMQELIGTKCDIEEQK